MLPHCNRYCGFFFSVLSCISGVHHFWGSYVTGFFFVLFLVVVFEDWGVVVFVRLCFVFLNLTLEVVAFRLR